jgi:DNA invertase Pin-like site-specific DNA recombinase
MNGEIIGYARESSEKQEMEGNALTKQICRLRDSGAIRIFYDIAQRSSNKRDGLLQLIKYVKSRPVGSIQKIIFTRIDRLTSNIVLFSQLFEVLKQHKVKMEALDDALDMESLGGKLATNIRVIAAEFETEMLSLRVGKDLEVRRKNNKPHYITPFGYVRDCDRYQLDQTPVVCTLEDGKEYTRSQLARLVVDTYFAVRSYRQTAMQLNHFFGVCRNTYTIKDRENSNIINIGDEISSTLTKPQSRNPGLGWTAKGLQLWLRNPILAGGTPYDQRLRNKYSQVYQEDKIVWDTHNQQCLITLQEREQILSIARENRNNAWASVPSTINNIYAGLLHCAQCGGAFFIQTSQYRKKADRLVSYYQCNTYNKNRLCKNKRMISDIQIAEQLIPLLCQKAETLAALEEEPDNQEEIDEPEEVTALRQQLRQLTVIPGNNPAIAQAIDSINQQINSILAEIKNQHQSYFVGRENIIAAFSNPLYWQEIDPDDKKQLLKGCLKSIQVNNGQIVKVIFRYSI